MADSSPYYIGPDSKIYVLQGVPLDNTYEHTIAWPDTQNARQDQTWYFYSKRKLEFEKQYYTREKRGWLRIECNPDTLYDCNYLMFQNSAFGKKWFYAFILSVEYVNNNTAQINYEIDVMQTWLRGTYGDYRVNACFIERQHTPSDELYENLVPEDVDLGQEYVNCKVAPYGLNDTKIVILHAGKYTGNKFEPWVAQDGEIVNRVYGALHAEIFSVNTAGLRACNDYLYDLYTDGKENNIVSVYMVPSKFVTGFDYSTRPFKEGIRPITPPNKNTNLGTPNSPYKPKNNKLYSYPYCRLMVSNQCGGQKEYKWELFDNNSDRGSFWVFGKFGWRVCSAVVPIHYKGFGEPDYLEPSLQTDFPQPIPRTLENLDEALILDQFPICSWNGDGYKAWWAQNTPTVGVAAAVGSKAVAGAIDTALATSAGAGAAILGGVGGIAGYALVGAIASSLFRSRHQPDRPYGDTNSTNLNSAVDNLGFAFYSQSLRKEQLKLYDDYFTKFGYAIKSIGFPGYMNRQRWTYVKTIGFTVDGNINNEDSNKISKIYDNGITFWRDPADIGNYQLDNKPIV